jgi:hypothetical protein
VDERFWARPYGPVLLYLGGHAPLQATPEGFILDVAKNLSAAVIALEHRFYGESLVNSDMESVKEFLRVEQVMADTASFRERYQQDEISPLGSSQNRWILVGAGYAGELLFVCACACMWIERERECVCVAFASVYVGMNATEGCVWNVCVYRDFMYRRISVLGQGVDLYVLCQYTCTSDALLWE